ncbi:hypothetical protein E2C01_024418 [Portunus trituberculatus]|uniref:Uncharacterized protein n=1 Tax=Portunus trituberculatus TaxID=210409 RepID=A0A5B7ECS8_PORTR|nr:hypothetical protein [Portunus trituberculatus]
MRTERRGAEEESSLRLLCPAVLPRATSVIQGHSAVGRRLSGQQQPQSTATHDNILLSDERDKRDEGVRLPFITPYRQHNNLLSAIRRESPSSCFQ